METAGAAGTEKALAGAPAVSWFFGGKYAVRHALCLTGGAAFRKRIQIRGDIYLRRLFLRPSGGLFCRESGEKGRLALGGYVRGLRAPPHCF